MEREPVMNTITTEREITTTETDTTYRCDLCDHTTDSESDMLAHEGEKHSYTESKDIDCDTYLKFDDEAGFNRWTAWKATDSYTNIDAKWKGPGWYWDRTEERSRGCGCGCTDEYRVLTYAPDRSAALRDKAERLTERANEIEQMTGAAR